VTKKGCASLSLLLSLAAAPVAHAQCVPPAGRYAGPLFDAMAQIDGGMEAVVLRSLDASGVARMALFGRDKGRRSGAPAVAHLARERPGVFVVGAPKRFDQRVDLSGDYVRAILAGARSREYAFVGEILFAHADKAHGEQTADGERYADPAQSGTRRLLEGLKDLGIPVMAHWEVYDWDRDWPGFKRLYADYPGQVFIWPHAGFGSAAQVAEVLADRSNVVVTLSKKEESNRALSDRGKAGLLGDALVDECGTLRPEWRSLLLKHADRFLFATDAHKDFRWERYARIVERWRAILAQLPPETAAAMAYRNAERLYAPGGGTVRQ